MQGPPLAMPVPTRGPAQPSQQQQQTQQQQAHLQQQAAGQNWQQAMPQQLVATHQHALAMQQQQPPQPPPPQQQQQHNAPAPATAHVTAAAPAPAPAPGPGPVASPVAVRTGSGPSTPDTAAAARPTNAFAALLSAASAGAGGAAAAAGGMGTAAAAKPSLMSLLQPAADKQVPSAAAPAAADPAAGILKMLGVRPAASAQLAPAPAAPLPPLPAPAGPVQAALQAQLQAGATEAAFTSALNAQDVGAVLFACAWCTAAAAREGLPPVASATRVVRGLSPMLQLCLLQQMAVDAGVDTDLKLAWLEAVAAELAARARAATSRGEQDADWALVRPYLGGVVGTAQQLVDTVARGGSAAGRAAVPRIAEHLRALTGQ
jgi:hypothetical protein